MFPGAVLNNVRNVLFLPESVFGGEGRTGAGIEFRM